MAPTPEKDVTTCDLCGKKLHARGEWVSLNRYVINCASGWQMISAGADEDYAWDVHDRSYSARTLCLDKCLHTWISGEMIEIKVRRKKSG